MFGITIGILRRPQHYNWQYLDSALCPIHRIPWIWLRLILRCSLLSSRNLKVGDSLFLQELRTETLHITQQYDSEWYRDIYRQWVHRHHRCIEHGGEYLAPCRLTCVMCMVFKLFVCALILFKLCQYVADRVLFMLHVNCLMYIKIFKCYGHSLKIFRTTVCSIML